LKEERSQLAAVGKKLKANFRPIALSDAYYRAKKKGEEQSISNCLQWKLEKRKKGHAFFENSRDRTSR